VVAAATEAGAPSNVVRLRSKLVSIGASRLWRRFAMIGSVDSLYVMSVEDLEAAVSHLSTVECARFREWFEEFAADQWDREIEADIRAGRFDAAGKRADEDFEAGRCTPL